MPQSCAPLASAVAFRLTSRSSNLDKNADSRHAWGWPGGGAAAEPWRPRLDSGLAGCGGPATRSWPPSSRWRPSCRSGAPGRARGRWDLQRGREPGSALPGALVHRGARPGPQASAARTPVALPPRGGWASLGGGRRAKPAGIAILSGPHWGPCVPA